MNVHIIYMNEQKGKNICAVLIIDFCASLVNLRNKGVVSFVYNII